MHNTDLDLPLSSLVLNMEESATIAMAQLARDVAAEGHDVISLTLGEPDFDTPEHIKEAAKQALDDGYTKYTPVPGLPELRKAIVTKFKRDNGLDFEMNQIMVSNGAKQVIANICIALLNKGDEVLIFAPFWVSYKAIVEMHGGVAVPVYAGIEQDFKPTPEQVAAAITDKTKLVIFSSPCNPTGSVFSKDEMHALAEVFDKHKNLIIISDEIYEYINFIEEGHFSLGSIECMKDQVVTVNGFAKGFAMTGWRLGYMGGPPWLVKACSKIQGQFTSGANSFGQKAAAIALMSDLTPSYKMRDAFQKRRELVINAMSKIPGMKLNFPKGAFYVFPDVSHFYGMKSDEGFAINNSVDFCEYLLRKAFVGSVPGVAFGAPNNIRLSYAASDEKLAEAMNRIKAVCSKLS